MNTVNLRLYSQQLTPSILLTAFRDFWGILRHLDAAISKDPRGTVVWTIEKVNKASPMLVEFQGHSRIKTVDYTPRIVDDCVVGLKTLSETGERPHIYSDAVLAKVFRLAQLQRVHFKAPHLNSIEVFADTKTAILNNKTLSNIEALITTRYESIGSIVGDLDSITVHKGSEFRIWEEVTGQSVRCKFPDSMLRKVTDLLGKRVVAYGELNANYKGQVTYIQISALDTYSEESELPTIEEMSGLIEDITDGVSLNDYLEGIRHG